MSHDWPKTLNLDPGAIKALDRVPKDHPELATWPEGERFREHDQAQAIADVLIGTYHKELANARIVYLFREKAGVRGQAPLAKTVLLGGRESFLSEMDFAIVVNWEGWRKLDLVQRVALVDHELEHCGVEDGGGFVLLHHDIEEFNCIAQRWGAVQEDLRRFFTAARTQFEMFAPEPEKETASS